MKVYGTITQEVEINPIEIMERLINQNIGIDGWVFEKNGKYFRGYEQSAGTHSLDMLEEISKEKYDFIRSLENCIYYLKKQ